MENLKEALLVELLESDLTTEKRNQLLINLVKNNITEEELQDYQSMRLAIKLSDESSRLMTTIDTDELQARIMDEIRTTKTFYDRPEEFKKATVGHLISAQRVKSDRYS